MRLVATAFIGCAIVSYSAAAFALQTGVTGGGQPVDNVQPSLGVTYLIRAEGEFNGLGEIVPFGGGFTPLGWLKCEGQTLPVGVYDGLFSRIGNYYGGDGVAEFKLPDLRGRTVIHYGQGDGLSQRDLGSLTGVEQITLNVSQMPSHDHSLPMGGSTSATGGNQPASNVQPSLAMNYVLPLQGNWPFPDTGAAQTPFFGQVRLFGGTNVPAGHVSADGQLVTIAQNTSLFSQLGVTYGGNGVNTFALPDLRGRTVVHEGTGPGLSPRSLGQEEGDEQDSLTVSQLPAHEHTLPPSPDVTGTAGGGVPYSNMQPSGVLNYIIARSGEFPGPGIDNGNATFLCKMALTGAATAPDGWAFCDGQLLTIAQNTALFAILGTTYGGDGQVTFALPDLRGRAIVGAGQGPGLSEVLRGEVFGEENTTLTVAQLPPHVHDYVPEPASLALVALAMLAPARHRFTAVRLS